MLWVFMRGCDLQCAWVGLGAGSGAGVGMRHSPLLTLHEVRLDDGAGGSIGPVNWRIGRGQRIQLEVADDAQFAALVELFSGRGYPGSGYLEELRSVRVQSDKHLRKSLILNRSITDYLNMPAIPEFVWLENRRRSVRVLLDKLGLVSRQFRLPLKFQAAEVIDKFVAFRFVMSPADLLVGGWVFSAADPAIAAVLKMRWGDFPGTVIACVPPSGLPGRADAVAVISSEGAFSCQASAVE